MTHALLTMRLTNFRLSRSPGGGAVLTPATVNGVREEVSVTLGLSSVTAFNLRVCMGTVTCEQRPKGSA